jgi:acyl-coenzyme A synthetase/AMP-(fatty) acid ligase
MKGAVHRQNRSSLLWKSWERILERRGRRIVLIEAADGQAYRAKDLNGEALKLVSLLAHFREGTRIAFCLPNGAQWIAFFLALQKLGLAATPLDAGLPEQACRETANLLHCGALFYGETLHLLDHAGTAPKTICCIKVTSGSSSGLPKNVPCRAEHLMADGANLIRSMGIRSDDRNLACIPLGHSYGLGNLVMPLILQGTALVCASQFVPRQIGEWIRRYSVTVFPSVPALYRVLAALPGTSRLSPLRLAISAGAPLSPEVARAFFERYRLKIHNFYGSSETGGICFDKTGEASLHGRSVGKPVAGVSVSAEGGTIRVTSAAVAKRKGTWRMPDHGEWNTRGELVLLGRRGREVNLGGKKVHPSEAERALLSIPGVSDVVVWAAGNSSRAFLNAAVETTLSLREVQGALSARLPTWKLPKRFLIKKNLPRTARGKIDVASLRQEMESGGASHSPALG